MVLVLIARLMEKVSPLNFPVENSELNVLMTPKKYMGW